MKITVYILNAGFQSNKWLGAETKLLYVFVFCAVNFRKENSPSWLARKGMSSTVGGVDFQRSRRLAVRTDALPFPFPRGALPVLWRDNESPQAADLHSLFTEPTDLCLNSSPRTFRVTRAAATVSESKWKGSRLIHLELLIFHVPLFCMSETKPTNKQKTNAPPKKKIEKERMDAQWCPDTEQEHDNRLLSYPGTGPAQQTQWTSPTWLHFCHCASATNPQNDAES